MERYRIETCLSVSRSFPPEVPVVEPFPHEGLIIAQDDFKLIPDGDRLPYAPLGAFSSRTIPVATPLARLPVFPEDRRENLFQGLAIHDLPEDPLRDPGTHAVEERTGPCSRRARHGDCR
ncbi:MAG: hypothetical protein MZU97_18815 [Bacillus subtilis]|nr:hypothetical protein [Bacillus subtilis]